MEACRSRSRSCQPRDKRENEAAEPKPPKTQAAPSRPDIVEVHNGPGGSADHCRESAGHESPAAPGQRGLASAGGSKAARPPTEAAAVEFVFKYGLALIAMGLLDSAKKTTEWNTNEVECREQISKSAAGVGRVIVPLCLTLAEEASEGGLT